MGVWGLLSDREDVRPEPCYGHTQLMPDSTKVAADVPTGRVAKVYTNVLMNAVVQQRDTRIWSGGGRGLVTHIGRHAPEMI